MPTQQNQYIENMKISAAVALSHICKLKPIFFDYIFKKITPRYFIHNLMEGQNRIQQAFITMLNLALQ